MKHDLPAETLNLSPNEVRAAIDDYVAQYKTDVVDNLSLVDAQATKANVDVSGEPYLLTVKILDLLDDRIEFLQS